MMNMNVEQWVGNFKGHRTVKIIYANTNKEANLFWLGFRYNIVVKVKVSGDCAYLWV